MEDNITRVEFQNKLKMLVINSCILGFPCSFSQSREAFRYHGVIDMTAPGFRYNVFQPVKDAA